MICTDYICECEYGWQYVCESKTSYTLWYPVQLRRIKQLMKFQLTLFTSSYNRYDHNLLACSWVFFLPDPLNIYLVPRFFLIDLSKNIIPTFDTIIQ
jgi:hypothetical protein